MTLDTAPLQSSWSTIMIKTLIGLITGIVISILIFVVLVLMGGVIETALTSTLTGAAQSNPLLSFILISISFIGTFVGCFLIAGIYNVLYSETYYDMSKMISLLLFANIGMFILFVGLYLVFSTSVTTLFFVLAFHVMFTVFVSYTLIEISTNPNYAPVHLLGGAIALGVSFFVLSVTFTQVDIGAGNTISYLLSLPPVLIFLSLPLWHGIRERVYYSMYENGYNIFYVPSLSEVTIESDDESEITVSMD